MKRRQDNQTTNPVPAVYYVHSFGEVSELLVLDI